ncbi:phage tail tape measure protein [Pontitalea aquivivens]|uniref:hypothetical protein n=1 Tax=Pontitalea aquivivens TaxID=3388663 RepID=UPI0039709B30
MARKIVGDVAIQVGADISPLVTQMDRAKGKVSAFGNDVESTSAKMAAMGKRAAVAGAAIVSTAGAIGAAAQYVVNYAQQLERLSSISGTSVERFQSLAFASREFGVEQEKLADILKDVNDKLGDYFQTGAGPLADFFDQIAPKVNLTADAFRGLTAPDALQLYVTSLEKANVSQAEMTFYMEALASDASALIPLLYNSGAAMNELEQAARDLGVVIDQDLIEKSSRMGKIWDRMMTAMSARFITFAATVMNGFDAIFGLTEEAQLSIGSEQISKLADERAKVIGEIEAARQREQVAAAASFGTAPKAGSQIDFLEAQLQAIEDEMNIENDKLMEMQQLVLKREEAKARLEALSDGSSQPSVGDVDGGGSGGSKIDKGAIELERLRDQFASEQELIQQQYDERLAMLEEFREAERISQDEYNQMSLAAQAEYNDAMEGLDRKKRDAMIVGLASMFGDLSSLMSTNNKKLFAIGKAAAIAEATVSGYHAAVEAWDKGMKIGGYPMATAWAAGSLAKTGALISNIAAQQLGGSSSGAASSAGAAPTAAAATPQMTANYTITGDVIGKQTGGELIRSINEAIRSGYQINLEWA